MNKGLNLVKCYGYDYLPKFPMVVWYVSVRNGCKEIRSLITIRSDFSILLPEQQGFRKGFGAEMCQTGCPVQGTAFLEKVFIQKYSAWSPFMVLCFGGFSLCTYRLEQRWKVAEIPFVESFRLNGILSRHNFHWQELCALSFHHSTCHTYSVH